MGLFTTVITERCCAGCSALFVTGVQFKTGHEEGQLPECRDGERLPNTPPGIYDGIADAYCDRCLRRWIADEKRSNFIALAQAVADGALAVRRGFVMRDERRTPIPDHRGDFTIEYLDDREVAPNEIESEGGRPDERAGWPTFSARISNLDYVLLEKGERIFPTRIVNDSDWWFRHRTCLAALMEARGWPLGGEQWVDVNVVVSSDFVVRVDRDPPTSLPDRTND